MAEKSVVKLAAYLSVCPNCEMHACVVLPDGRKTRHFGARDIGRSIIKLLAEGGCIDAKGVALLNDQLAAAQGLSDEGFPEEAVFSLEEAFRSERGDRLDEDSSEPPRQYVM